ncbi:TetR/AcrR family transcriptional regulator [Rhodococcoides kyotonense]|uniref:DNA-binding transcriptional regulator, AcrR family n=1 Tax=Rhodococcoides kyotonense TaxID=398843 RepID=A0A239DWA4_9NOCA|nr:TetR/AcrR family transcriptional regulator [Rhodococcus kyotonensis]SNS36776.1 DNA-binding transcriptional regulator, AcrR family [Rhodococcus kyotonensis]
MTETRSRNAGRTRQDLLDAATELFGTRGYERTTIREIGERAGADPALIARYFGNKAALYLATLPTDDTGPDLADILDPGRIEETLRRVAGLGPGPVLHAVIRRHDDDAVQAAASTRVEKRMTEGLERRLSDRGVESARLRAQLAVAALSGIALARSAGTLETLSDADPDEVVRLTGAMLETLLSS